MEGFVKYVRCTLTHGCSSLAFFLLSEKSFRRTQKHQREQVSRNCLIMRFLHLCLLGQLAGLSIAHPSISTVVTPKHKSTRLSNEPLSQDLNYLKDELIAHMPATNATALQWEGGWLPKDCQDQMVGKYNVSASDIEVYNVTFDDCSAPWIMCRSKDSQQPVEELILDFSRIPVRARSYVKHGK